MLAMAQTHLEVPVSMFSFNTEANQEPLPSQLYEWAPPWWLQLTFQDNHDNPSHFLHIRPVDELCQYCSLLLTTEQQNRE
jgi:hypothetical protein